MPDPQKRFFSSSSELFEKGGGAKIIFLFCFLNNLKNL
jgi:hypothetical protein